MCGQRYFLLRGLGFFSHFVFHSLNVRFIVPNSFYPAVLCLMLFFVIEAVKAFLTNWRMASVWICWPLCCISTALCCRLQCCCCSYYFSLCRCLLSNGVWQCDESYYCFEEWRLWGMSPGPEYIHLTTFFACIIAVRWICFKKPCFSVQSCERKTALSRALLLVKVVWRTLCMYEVSLCKAIWQWSVFYDYNPQCLKCLEWIWMKNPYF